MTPMRASVVCLVAAALGAVLFLVGCGKSPPTRFYSLTPVPAAEEGEGRGQPDGGPGLGIGPLEFPAYLDRTQIVTTGEGTAMHLAEFDQWIEPVRENFQRILLENLTGVPGSGPVVSHPWPDGVRPERQVAIQVRRFDGAMGREAALRAEWSVRDAEGRMLLWRQTSLREAVDGADYAALVAAQSRLVAALAAEIVQGLAQVR